jgi:replicative DNA helicase
MDPSIRQQLEARVLCDMLYGQPDACQQVLERADFAIPAHRDCFDALLALRQLALPAPGLSVLLAWLSEHQRTVDTSAVAAMLDGISVRENIRPAVSWLKRAALMDQIRSTGRSLDDMDLDAAVTAMRATSERASNLMARDDYQSLDSILDTLKAEDEQGPDPRQLPTGFPDLDRYGALTRASLTVLAGSTSHGKTALACSIVARWVAWDRGVVYATSEESPGQIVGRIARIVSGGRESLRGSKLHVGHARRVSQIEGAVASAPFEVEALVVDHLHELHSERQRESHVLELGDLMRDLRELAHRHNVPLLILAQLNRKPGTEDRKPRLTDLRASGEIEITADRAWLLWRDLKNTTPAEIWIGKNRMGEANAAVPLVFDPRRICFHSAAKEERSW